MIRKGNRKQELLHLKFCWILVNKSAKRSFASKIDILDILSQSFASRFLTSIFRKNCILPVNFIFAFEIFVISPSWSVFSQMLHFYFCFFFVQRIWCCALLLWTDDNATLSCVGWSRCCPLLMKKIRIKDPSNDNCRNWSKASQDSGQTTLDGWKTFLVKDNSNPYLQPISFWA